MSSGKLLAVARYKKRTDYQPDLSTDPPTAASREDHFSYSVSYPIEITELSSTEPTEFIFNFSDPIPAGITDLYLHVVFKGTLGNEIGTAIAVGMKDINEPQHIILVNSTDRVYLDHALYTANEIRSDPNLVWPLEDEYLDPYNDMDIGIAFFPDPATYPTLLHAACLTMPAASYSRIIILAAEPSDEQSYFYYHVQWVSPSREDGQFGYAPMEGVINQDNSDGIFNPTEVQTFRGMNAHLVRWVCWNSPDADGLMSADGWPIMENELPRSAVIWP
jgi:hypothetical protein